MEMQHFDLSKLKILKNNKNIVLRNVLAYEVNNMLLFRTILKLII